MSEKKDIKLFDLLKKEVSETLRKKHAGCNEDISQWKGREIKLFQEHLEETVQGRISEKWFYTHLKSEETTLPRIDILNLLSEYCGHRDWLEFREKNLKAIKEKSLYLYFLPILVLSPILWYAFADSHFQYNIQVMDAITLQQIPVDKVEVIWLKADESPMWVTPNENEQYVIESPDRQVAFVVSAPYYFTDTLRRSLSTQMMKEMVLLRPNDYALMINLFSKSKIEEWEKRREKLNDIFAPNASIFQVDEQGMGMEIYNKEEFIETLSFPHSKLKNIEVLETRMYKNKIVFLRFKVQ